MQKDGRGQLRVEFRNCSGNVPGSSKGGVTWGHLVLSKSRAGGPGVCTDPGRETVPRGGGPWNAQPRPISPDLQVIIVLQAPQTKRKHAYGTRQPTQLTMRCANTVLCCPMLCALLVDSSMRRRGNATTATADNCLDVL